MPGFDGTGPYGRGEMTGGGRGWCIVEVKHEKTEFFPRCICHRAPRVAAQFRYGHHFTTRPPKEDTSQ